MAGNVMLMTVESEVFKMLIWIMAFATSIVFGIAFDESMQDIILIWMWSIVDFIQVFEIYSITYIILEYLKM